MVRYGIIRYGMVWFGLVWFGLVWFGLVVNDNEFAAAILRPSGGICDAGWRGPPHAQCALAEELHGIRWARAGPLCR